jgi:transposase
MKHMKEEAAALERALAKRYWAAEDARLVLAACAASRLSDSAFAEREGISAQRLGWWRRRLGPVDLQPAPERPAFVPVRVVSERASAPVAGPSSRIEVVLLSGRRLVLSADFDTRAVAQLVDLLEEVGP